MRRTREEVMAMPTAARPVRVMIVDDHEVVRRGMRMLLTERAGVEVVAEAGTAREGVSGALAWRPDVVLMDLRLPDSSGIEACREIRTRDHEIRVLVVTSFDEDAARSAASLAGASGFVLKQVRGEELREAVRRVAQGRSPARVPDPVGSPTTDDPRLRSLTPQELRVLALITEGLSNREIGDRIGISEKTVRNYVSGLLGKLGFARRAQAAVYGARAGTLSSGGLPRSRPRPD
ncbi:MAG: response regulator [Kineosporiaceae bacterium]